MPVKLSTTISNISSIPNIANSTLINKFYQYMKSIGTSESYQNGNLKITIYFAGFLGTTDFLSIKRKEQVLSLLDTRIMVQKLILKKDGSGSWMIIYKE
jgi:integrase/recombinase XerD